MWKNENTDGLLLQRLTSKLYWPHPIWAQLDKFAINLIHNFGRKTPSHRIEVMMKFGGTILEEGKWKWRSRRRCLRFGWMNLTFIQWKWNSLYTQQREGLFCDVMMQRSATRDILTRHVSDYKARRHCSAWVSLLGESNYDEIMKMASLLETELFHPMQWEKTATHDIAICAHIQTQCWQALLKEQQPTALDPLCSTSTTIRKIERWTDLTKDWMTFLWRGTLRPVKSTSRDRPQLASVSQVPLAKTGCSALVATVHLPPLSYSPLLNPNRR